MEVSEVTCRVSLQRRPGLVCLWGHYCDCPGCGDDFTRADPDDVDAFTERNTRHLLRKCRDNIRALDNKCVQQCCRVSGLHSLPAPDGAGSFVYDYRWIPQANRFLLWKLGYMNATWRCFGCLRQQMHITVDRFEELLQSHHRSQGVNKAGVLPSWDVIRNSYQQYVQKYQVRRARGRNVRLPEPQRAGQSMKQIPKGMGAPMPLPSYIPIPWY